MTPLQHIDSKEDLFEDAPEELTSTASKETSPAVSKDGNDFNNGVEDNQYLVDELERVCELLDRAVNEKNSIEKKCKVGCFLFYEFVDECFMVKWVFNLVEFVMLAGRKRDLCKRIGRSSTSAEGFDG